jgi:nicotinate-nucleotide adenylyltransferase
MKQLVGIFGGSFNPPHVAHVLGVAYAQLIAGFDRVLVIPVFQHPFAKGLAAFEHRLRMCELAFAQLPFVTVSDVERQLGGESRTLRTLEHLSQAHAEWDLRLVLGTDVLSDLPKWHRFDRIAELAPPLFLERAGHPSRSGTSGVLPEVSSTEVRSLFARGAESAERLGQVVPRAVVAYAADHSLYA